MSPWSIYEKKVDGISVGFIVAVPVHNSRWRWSEDRRITHVRNIRQSMRFDTVKAAQEFITNMESRRAADPVTFTEVK